MRSWALARARYESAPALDERPPSSHFKKYEKSPPFKESRTVLDYQVRTPSTLPSARPARSLARSLVRSIALAP